MPAVASKRTLRNRILYTYCLISLAFATMFAVYRPFSAAYLARERALESASLEFNKCLQTAWQEPPRMAACQSAYDTGLRRIRDRSWVRPEYYRSRLELILSAASLAAAVVLLAWRRFSQSEWEPPEPGF
jgi:hypothetical protein